MKKNVTIENIASQVDSIGSTNNLEICLHEKIKWVCILLFASELMLHA